MKQIAAIYIDGTLGEGLPHEWRREGIQFSLAEGTEMPLDVPGGKPGLVVGVAFLLHGKVVGAVAADGMWLPQMADEKPSLKPVTSERWIAIPAVNFDPPSLIPRSALGAAIGASKEDAEQKCGVPCFAFQLKPSGSTFTDAPKPATYRIDVPVTEMKGE